MKTLVLALSISLVSIVSVAAQQNPYQSPYGYGQQQQREPELKYNPYGNKWEYAPPDSELRYNPYENRWERD